MRPLFLAAALLLPLALPAAAALNPGATAPDFTADGAINGKKQRFTLSALLRKGPVVVYFFPAAFTAGCNAEAKAFAQALPRFQAAGATVIGLTAGNAERLVEFSVEHCAGKFPVAAASADTIRGYDVRLVGADGKATAVTSRTSYVIAPDRRIVYAFTDMKYADHVKNTLAAVERYRASRR